MVSRRGGHVYRKSWHAGAWMECRWMAGVNPAARLLVSGASSQRMAIFLNGALNDGPAVSAGDVTLAPVANSENTLWVFIAAGEPYNGGLAEAEIKGVQVDQNSTPEALSLGRPTLIFGDSIACGYKSNAGVTDFITGHIYFLLQMLEARGYDVGVDCSSGSGWDRPGSAPAYYRVSGSSTGEDGTYSARSSRWDTVDFDVSMLDRVGHLSGWGRSGQEPVLIMGSLGANDLYAQIPALDVQASEYDWLVAARAAAPAAKILLETEWSLEASGAYPSASYPLRPATYIEALSAGISTYKAERPEDSNVFVEDEGETFASSIYSNPFFVNDDKVHPLLSGHALIAVREAQMIQRLLMLP